MCDVCGTKYIVAIDNNEFVYQCKTCKKIHKTEFLKKLSDRLFKVEQISNLYSTIHQCNTPMQFLIQINRQQ